MTVVGFIKETLTVFVQLVTDRHFGLVAGFDVEQATGSVAAVILPTFEIDLCFRHLSSTLVRLNFGNPEFLVRSPLFI